MQTLFDTEATFRRKTVEVDQYGQPAETWKDYIITDVFVSQTSGNKRFQSDKDGHFSTHKIKCGVYGFTESDRVLLDGAEYEIMNVNPLNKTKHLEIDISRNV